MIRDPQTGLWPAVQGGNNSPLRGNPVVMTNLLEQAPPEQLVELFLPHLWASMVDGAPSNICVDACLTLRYAFGQLGIRSELQPVGLATRDADGREIEHAPVEPAWRDGGTRYTGHCLLMLPDSGRMVDPTVEQFAAIRALDVPGPLGGKVAAASQPLTAGELLPPGALIVLQRGPLAIQYAVSPAWAREELLGQPWVAEHADLHRRTGINLASLMITALRAPSVVGRARQAPYPRLRALLKAVGDAPAEPDEARDLRFLVRGGNGVEQRLRLDEIPLPPATPAAYPNV